MSVVRAERAITHSAHSWSSALARAPWVFQRQHAVHPRRLLRSIRRGMLQHPRFTGFRRVMRSGPLSPLVSGRVSGLHRCEFQADSSMMITCEGTRARPVRQESTSRGRCSSSHTMYNTWWVVKRMKCRRTNRDGKVPWFPVPHFPTAAEPCEHVSGHPQSKYKPTISPHRFACHCGRKLRGSDAS